MTYYDAINALCKEHNGVITSSMVREQDIPSWYLSDMVKKGTLQRITRGIYSVSAGDHDEYYFFQLTNSRCVYSYHSALYLHGMTDRIPFVKEVTVYKGYNSSHIRDDTIIHHVSKNIYELGITDAETIFGNPVKTYDKERTICDLVAGRKRIDTEVFSKALRAYVEDPDRDYKRLRSYARTMGIEEKLNDILEVL